LVFNLVTNGEATTNNNAVSGNMENQCDESSYSSDIISCMATGTTHQSKENDTTERCSGLCLTSDVHPHNVSINIKQLPLRSKQATCVHPSQNEICS